MKEIKDKWVKVRVSSSQKEQIEAYCERYEITTSEFMRLAFDYILNGVIHKEEESNERT